MMNTLKTLTAIGLLFLSTTGCGDDDDATGVIPPRADGRTEVDLTNIEDAYGTWRIESIIIEDEAVDINEDGSKNTNLLLELPSCFLDNTFLLQNQSLFSFTDTFTTCDINEQDMILQEGIVTFRTSAGFFLNQLVFKESQVNGDKRGYWDKVKVLTDLKNPTKKYLQFSAFAGDIAADSFTTDSRATVIMIADK